jgi:hypothetical protein
MQIVSIRGITLFADARLDEDTELPNEMKDGKRMHKCMGNVLNKGRLELVSFCRFERGDVCDCLGLN